MTVFKFSWRLLTHKGAVTTPSAFCLNVISMLGPDDIPARFAWSTRSTGSSWVPRLHGEYGIIILLLLVSVQVDASVLMVHDVFQGLQGIPGPKVRVSALVLIRRKGHICYFMGLCSVAGWTWIWSKRRYGRNWGSRTTSKWHWLLIGRTGPSWMSHWCWAPHSAGITRLPGVTRVSRARGSSWCKGREGTHENSFPFIFQSESWNIW